MNRRQIVGDLGARAVWLGELHANGFVSGVLEQEQQNRSEDQDNRGLGGASQNHACAGPGGEEDAAEL